MTFMARWSMLKKSRSSISKYVSTKKTSFRGMKNQIVTLVEVDILKLQQRQKLRSICNSAFVTYEDAQKLLPHDRLDLIQQRIHLHDYPHFFVSAMTSSSHPYPFKVYILPQMKTASSSKTISSASLPYIPSSSSSSTCSITQPVFHCTKTIIENVGLEEIEIDLLSHPVKSLDTVIISFRNQKDSENHWHMLPTDWIHYNLCHSILLHNQNLHIDTLDMRNIRVKVDINFKKDHESQENSYFGIVTEQTRFIVESPLHSIFEWELNQKETDFEISDFGTAGSR